MVLRNQGSLPSESRQMPIRFAVGGHGFGLTSPPDLLVARWPEIIADFRNKSNATIPGAAPSGRGASIAR